MENQFFASGTCGAQGDNLTWTLTPDGTLTISGKGDMEDYEDFLDVPWYAYREHKRIYAARLTVDCRPLTFILCALCALCGWQKPPSGGWGFTASSPSVPLPRACLVSR